MNAGKVSAEGCRTFVEFVEKFYLKVIEEKRASTKKRYTEIWNNHIRYRIGHSRMRECRTVDASRMLKAIANENGLTRTTLQHIKGVLSGIFTHAKNEGAFDGANPVRDVRIPGKAREPGETYAYNLNQICRILDSLALLPKAVVATAAYAGLREGELRGLEWTDYQGDALSVNRSIWKTFTNKPKTRASANPVPVILHLAEILSAYRSSLGNPAAGVMFQSGGGEPMDLDNLAQLVIRPVVELIGIEWYGWHGFMRGVASNLYDLGPDEKIVQRVLPHPKPHVTTHPY